MRTTTETFNSWMQTMPEIFDMKKLRINTRQNLYAKKLDHMRHPFTYKDSKYDITSYDDPRVVACAAAAHSAVNALLIKQETGELVEFSDVCSSTYEERIYQVVQVVFLRSTPEEVHYYWSMQLVNEGWTYGDSLNSDHKMHPHLVAYDKLPQDVIDQYVIVVNTIREVARALSLM